MAVVQIANAFACRSETRPAWRVDPRRNRCILGAVAIPVIDAVHKRLSGTGWADPSYVDDYLGRLTLLRRHIGHNHGLSAKYDSDSLAGVIDDADYNADAIANTGDVSYAADTLTWTGALPKGATATISYSVHAHVAVTGDQDLTNRVVSVTPGSTCPADSPDPGCATTTPFAARTVELSGLTPSFTLSGAPHETVDLNNAVTMTVTTNSPDGYAVSVLSAVGALTSSVTGNGDSIPIGQLSVRESGTTAFSALSASLSTVVHQQDTASTPGG